MPETPILTKKQQKSSLSAKKSRTKNTIRNVLVTPYTKYWPLISTEQTELLRQILGNHLPRILPQRLRVPWKQLKELPKTERKLFRKEYMEKHNADSDKIILGEKEGLIFGVNDVTKALEKRLVKSILIVEDVQPKLMVEHLIDQSVLLHIPILVVPGLRDLLRETCGFSSIAIAFTDSVKYEVVLQTIKNLHQKYPVPRGHINFQRSLDLLNSSVIVIDNSVLEEESLKTSTYSNLNDSSSINRINENSDDKVYQFRKSKNERIFIPEKSSDQVKNNSHMQGDSTGFVSFSNSGGSLTKVYKSLSVKMVRQNADRKWRKIEEIKQKSKLRRSKALKNKSVNVRICNT